MQQLFVMFSKTGDARRDIFICAQYLYKEKACSMGIHLCELGIAGCNIQVLKLPTNDTSWFVRHIIEWRSSKSNLENSWYMINVETEKLTGSTYCLHLPWRFCALWQRKQFSESESLREPTVSKHRRYHYSVAITLCNQQFHNNMLEHKTSLLLG